MVDSVLLEELDSRNQRVEPVREASWLSRFLPDATDFFIAGSHNGQVAFSAGIFRECICDPVGQVNELVE